MRRMKLITAFFALSALAVTQPLFAQQQAGGPGPHIQNPVVVQFMIDGIDPNTVRTAVAAGATNIGSILKQGVTVQTYYCASPAPRLQLPDGSLPEGGSTAAIVALHTGTHLFESPNIDDIFSSARRAGIKSVMAGGSPNYVTFKTSPINRPSTAGCSISRMTARVCCICICSTSAIIGTDRPTRPTRTPSTCSIS